MRFGLSGLGPQQRIYWASLLQLGHEVVAAYHPGRGPDERHFSPGGNIESSDASARLDHSVRIFNDMGQFLESDLDAVCVASPTGLHGEQGKKVLEAGKTLLLDKPMGTTRSDVEGLLALAEKEPHRFFPLFCLPFFPPFDDLLSRLRSGQFGRLVEARLFRSSDVPAWGHFRKRQSGGVGWEFDIHNVDLAMRLLGDLMPEDVRSSAVFIPAEDSGEIPLSITSRLAGGQSSRVVSDWVIHTSASWRPPGHPFDHGFEVVCEDGSLRLGGGRFEVWHASMNPDAFVEVGYGGDGYHAMMVHILDCLEKGERSPILDVGTVRRTHNVMLQAYESLV